MTVFIFWISVLLIFFAYIGYPIFLYLLSLSLKKSYSIDHFKPTVDIIIPAYNEERIIEEKVKNTLNLDYPKDRFSIYVISDGSTDGTNSIMRGFDNKKITFIEKPKREGKASALNQGLLLSNNEIVIFTDASILLNKNSLTNILKPFYDSNIGCVSGEDHIPNGGGEGLYGKYELFLRNMESMCGSIVGASGCFYAQRRSLITNFRAGRAPDFLSVLETVRNGFRAVTEPTAIGYMGKIDQSKNEFKRKIRTIIRGITTLYDYKYLLNPFKFGLFSVEIAFHKLLRWSVGIFLIIILTTNIFLLNKFIYQLIFFLQIAFYFLAIIGFIKDISNQRPIHPIYRIPLFFVLSNLASIVAFFKYSSGTRQEIWESSKR